MRLRERPGNIWYNGSLNRCDCLGVGGAVGGFASVGESSFKQDNLKVS